MLCLVLLRWLILTLVMALPTKSLDEDLAKARATLRKALLKEDRAPIYPRSEETQLDSGFVTSYPEDTKTEDTRHPMEVILGDMFWSNENIGSTPNKPRVIQNSTVIILFSTTVSPVPITVSKIQVDVRSPGIVSLITSEPKPKTFPPMSYNDTMYKKLPLIKAPSTSPQVETESKVSSMKSPTKGDTKVLSHTQEYKHLTFPFMSTRQKLPYFQSQYKMESLTSLTAGIYFTTEKILTFPYRISVISNFFSTNSTTKKSIYDKYFQDNMGETFNYQNFINKLLHANPVNERPTLERERSSVRKTAMLEKEVLPIERYRRIERSKIKSGHIRPIDSKPGLLFQPFSSSVYSPTYEKVQPDAFHDYAYFEDDFVNCTEECDKNKRSDDYDFQKVEIDMQCSLPYTVVILRYETIKCGGTLVSDRYVLTAAHCFTKGKAVESPAIFSVRAGSSSWYKGGQYAQVSNFRLHPDYLKLRPSKYVNLHDLALVLVDTPFVIGGNLKFITVADPSMTEDINKAIVKGNACHMVTFRAVNSIQRNNEEIILSEVSTSHLPLIDTDACNQLIDPKGYEIDEKIQICTTCPESLCSGEEGTGLICDIYNVKILVGVLSSGSGCEMNCRPSVYSRIDTERSFITEGMRTLKDIQMRSEATAISPCNELILAVMIFFKVTLYR